MNDDKALEEHREGLRAGLAWLSNQRKRDREVWCCGQFLKSNQELLDRLAEHRAEIRARKVKRLAVSGSFGCSEADPSSDVDLLVEFEPGAKSFDRFLDLATYLEGLLQRRVDLVTVESLSPTSAPPS